MIFQVPGYISKMTTMSRGSVRLQIDTQEELRPDDISALMGNVSKIGWFTFNVHQIEAQDIVNLPPVQNIEGQKSSSQRLRGVLYRVWEKNNEGYKDFNMFYEWKMSLIIQDWKTLIT